MQSSGFMELEVLRSQWGGEEFGVKLEQFCRKGVTQNPRAAARFPCMMRLKVRRRRCR